MWLIRSSVLLLEVVTALRNEPGFGRMLALSARHFFVMIT